MRKPLPRFLPVLLVPSLLAAASPAPVELAPVIITAEHRSESDESVPVPTTVLTGGQVAGMGIEQIDQLSGLAPGLTIEMKSPSSPAINLRGITTDSGDPRQEARVSLFQNGVSISRIRGSAIALFDLERIEVLNGPQGTLFGRGAQNGAISFITNKPTDKETGAITFGAGNYEERGLDGFVNLPLVPGRLLTRFAFTDTQQDGFVRNLADGSDLDGQRTLAMRESFRLLSSTTTADLILDYEHDTPPGTAYVSAVIPGRDGRVNPFGPVELERGSRLGLDRTIDGAALLVESRLAPGWQFASTTGWRNFDSDEQVDADGSRLFLFESGERDSGRQFSQEVRLNYANDRLAGFLGAGWFHESGWRRITASTDERSLAAWFLRSHGIPLFTPGGDPYVGLSRNPLTGALLAPYHEEGYAEDGRTEAGDVFGDGTLRVAGNVRLTLGLRGTDERFQSGYQVFNSAQRGGFPLSAAAVPNDLSPPTNGRLTAARAARSWVGRAILSDNEPGVATWYAGVARGRRPPSLLVAAGPTVTYLHEEQVWNYEAGVKGAAWAHRLVWSASAFRYQYDHFQTTIAEPGAVSRLITADAGRAGGRGVELSARVAVARGLTAFGNYAFTEATFDGTGESGLAQQYAGNTFRLTPRNAFSIGGTATVHSGVEWFFTPVFIWRSTVHFSDDNHAFNNLLEQGDMGLLNLALGFRFRGGRGEVSVFGRSVLDKHYLVDAGDTGAGFGDPTFVPGPRRTLGVRIALGF